MADETDFIAWALAPGLTIEEAFCAELLTEFGLKAWKAAHRQSEPLNFEVLRARQKMRRFNPAHRAVLAERDVSRAAEMLPGMTQLEYWTRSEDRDWCDLSGLRFVPKLKGLHIGPARVANLDALRALPELEAIWLHDPELEDYSGLAHCPMLKKVALWPGFPWCDLRALAQLPALDHLVFHGNLPMLDGVGPLPAVTEVLMSGWNNGCAPLRDARQLPEMPALRKMAVEPFARLDGIGRFAAVQDLRISGCFRDLSPLVEMAEVRKLTLGGKHYHDVRPLTRMPRLRVLHFVREFPLDYEPLVEAPLLREVTANDENIAGLELSGLNMALGGWDDDFALPEPRPLGPLILRVRDLGENPAPGFESREGERLVFADEPELHEPEGEWLAQRLEKAITHTLGDADWGVARCSSYAAPQCSGDVEIESLDAADRLPEVLETCRRVLATLRNRWVLTLSIALKAEWEKDPEEWKDGIQRDLEDALEEAHGAAERRREYLDYLQRLQQYRLREQQGGQVEPEEFAPAQEQKHDEDSGLDDDWDRDDHPLWHDYYLRVRITEEGLWTVPAFRAKIERLMCRPVEGPRTPADDDDAADDGD